VSVGQLHLDIPQRLRGDETVNVAVSPGSDRPRRRGELEGRAITEDVVGGEPTLREVDDARFVAAVAYTWSNVTFGSAICAMAIVFDTWDTGERRIERA
jgi:hypothetical protein